MPHLLEMEALLLRHELNKALFQGLLSSTLDLLLAGQIVISRNSSGAGSQPKPVLAHTTLFSHLPTNQIAQMLQRSKPHSSHEDDGMHYHDG